MSVLFNNVRIMTKIMKITEKTSQNRRHLSIVLVSCPVTCAHHDLDLALADLQVVLVVDVHPLQGTSHPLIGPHQEHDSKAACRGKQTNDI